MINIKKILEDAFNSSEVTYPDSKPLFSERHPIFIEGIEIKDEWLDLYDAIHSEFLVWNVDRETSEFLSPWHEERYNNLMEAFKKAFLKGNKDDK